MLKKLLLSLLMSSTLSCAAAAHKTHGWPKDCMTPDVQYGLSYLRSPETVFDWIKDGLVYSASIFPLQAMGYETSLTALMDLMREPAPKNDEAFHCWEMLRYEVLQGEPGRNLTPFNETTLKAAAKLQLLDELPRLHPQSTAKLIEMGLSKQCCFMPLHDAIHKYSGKVPSFLWNQIKEAFHSGRLHSQGKQWAQDLLRHKE